MTPACLSPGLHSLAWIAFLAAMLGAWKLSEAYENWWNAKTEETSAVEDESMDEQLSLIEALERKDAVLDEIVKAKVDWASRGVRAFEMLPDHVEGIWEEIKARLLECGLSPPQNPKAQWGALCRLLVKRGLLVETGEWRAMKTDTSHGRRSPVWRKVAIQEQAA